MATRNSGGRFKRRSAMKMLHTTVDSATVASTAVAGTVIGYSHITRQLSAKYGRNMPQACTYRVVGLRAQIVNLADDFKDIGGSLAMQAQFVVPSRHRVAAHERIMREYVADVRDDSASSRARQLYVSLDGVQPVEPQESVLMRNDVVNRVNLLGANSAGVIGVFADYNLHHVKPEGTIGLNQPDQDLYTDQASQVLEQVIGRATMYGAWDDDTGASFTGAWGITGRYNGPVAVHDWEWWAPAGTYLPVMCGIVKWTCGDSWWPVLQGGTDTTIVAGTQYDPATPQRGATTVVFQTIVEGWTPLSSK